jgi:ankyrin repeat protein
MLLNAGSDLFAKDETEETPFLQAVEMGHTR